MDHNRWQKAVLVFACLVVGVLLLGVRASGQNNDRIPVIPASLPTTAPPTLLQFQLDQPGQAASDVPSNLLAAPMAISHTWVITALADTMVTQGYPTANCSHELEMMAGYDTYLNPEGETLYSLVKFNLVGISTEATVQSVTLRLFLSSSYDYPGHSVPITPYRISSPWSVDTVTWNSQPSYAEAYPSKWVTHGSGIWLSFDVTSLVRGWVAGTFPNYGLILVGPTTSWRGFATSETIYPPHLIVTYEQQPSFNLTLVPDEHAVLARQQTSSSSILYLIATDGFSESTALSIAGLPPHTAYAWSANPVTPTASTLLTLTTTPATPGGVYTFTIAGTSASLVRTIQGTLQVLQSDFEMSVLPPSRSIVVGEHALYTAHLVAVGGFTDSVTLDVVGIPPNAYSVWSLNPVTPTASTVLTVVTTSDTPTGTYPLTITGTSESIVHSTDVSLAVSTEAISKTVYLPLALRNYLGSLDTVHYLGHVTLNPLQEATDTVEHTAASRIALVTGVADYEHMGPPGTGGEGKTHDLLQPVHDVEDMSELIRLHMSTFGATSAWTVGYDGDTSMTVLVDSQATKGAIHSSIVNWIDPLEDEDTLVIIYFSGHGMYAPDQDGDEDDPYDEFIVPHDIDVNSEGIWLPETAISDDEFANWLDELESQHIVIFIDSCFAGGLIQGTSFGSTKSFSWNSSAQSEITAEQWRDSFVQDIQTAGRVILAATTEEQGSWEFGALQNGVFTYYLVEALHSPSADKNGNGWISAEEAYDYLDDKVDTYVWNHTVPHAHQNPLMSDGVSGEVDITQPVSVDDCPVWE